MITVGVDLSTNLDKTYMARVEWTRGRATLLELKNGEEASNAKIVSAAETSDRLAIDCPFGWPVTFMEFLRAFEADAELPAVATKEDRNRLSWRETDFCVRRELDIDPLKVAADRLGLTAMRCAALQVQLREAGVTVDRSGVQGSITEVYPAASILQWWPRPRQHEGYKDDPERLAGLVNSLFEKLAAPWLTAPPNLLDIVRRNDDAFDALIAALTARAVATDNAIGPTAEQRRIARREGWIWMPQWRSLGKLA